MMVSMFASPRRGGCVPPSPACGGGVGRGRLSFARTSRRDEERGGPKGRSPQRLGRQRAPSPTLPRKRERGPPRPLGSPHAIPLSIQGKCGGQPSLKRNRGSESRRYFLILPGSLTASKVSNSTL